MELSANIGWVDDDPVSVSCGAGYVLDMGVLEKNITCVLVNGVAVWSDTLGSCISKATIVIALITCTTSEIAFFYYPLFAITPEKEAKSLHRLNTFFCL